ncbi:MAG: hypothetical protein KKE23_00860 [Nanoarchaeota archaeon]|nr:hypothetical protein [Nanoarchaeota archaeon]
MRKIVTRAEREEKDKRLKFWLAIFIVGIMAASTAGFALNFSSDNEESRTYGDLKFTITEQGWQPKGYSIATSYLPQDVENISSKGTFSYTDFNSKVYLISAPYMQNEAIELLRYLPITNLQQACSKEDENISHCADVPLKSCEDASSQSAIIIFKESNETSIDYSGYCLQIQGDSEDILKAADKALFIAYGIID